MTPAEAQRPTTARDAMLQALGPAAVAMQMAPSPEQVLAALAAAGWVVVPRNVVVNAAMALRLHGSGVIAEGAADELRDVLAARQR